MLKKYWVWSVLTLVLAASGASAAELKIGVLDVQQALLASEEAQQFMEKAKADLKDEQGQVKSLEDELRGMQEKLEKDADVMSPTEKQQRQKDFENKQLDYRFQVNKLQKEVKDRQEELMQQMGPKLQAAIKDVVEADHYDMVLQRGDLIYADAKFSITRKVTEKLNEKRETSSKGSR